MNESSLALRDGVLSIYCEDVMYIDQDFCKEGTDERTCSVEISSMTQTTPSLSYLIYTARREDVIERTVDVQLSCFCCFLKYLR